MKMGAKESREVCRTNDHRSWWPIYRPYGHGPLAQPELGVGGIYNRLMRGTGIEY